MQKSRIKQEQQDFYWNKMEKYINFQENSKGFRVDRKISEKNKETFLQLKGKMGLRKLTKKKQKTWSAEIIL